MAHKHSSSRPHAEFRHRSQIPMPAVEEGEQQLVALLSPSLLAPRQMERRGVRRFSGGVHAVPERPRHPCPWSARHHFLTHLRYIGVKWPACI